MFHLGHSNNLSIIGHAAHLFFKFSPNLTKYYDVICVLNFAGSDPHVFQRIVITVL